MDVSPPPLQPLLSGAVDSPVNVDHSQREDPITGQSTACRADPTAQTYSGCAGPIKSHQTAAHKRKKKVKQINGSASSTVPSPSSSSSTCSPSLSQGGVRVACKRRNPRVFVGSVRRGERDAQAIALPLGMSIAAVIAQVLESKDTTGERMCVDHLSTICTSAVRESLANVFGDRFNCFVGNFEKSFQSTLKTLRMINESKQIRGRDHSYHLNIESCESDLDSSVFPSEGGPAETSGLSNLQSEEVILPAIETQDQLSTVEEIGESMQTDSVNLELALHQQRSQHAACVSLNALGSQGSVVNQSMLCTFEKSIMEQARSNDLKTYEIGLQMKKLQLKEAQLALNSDSNLLERFKLSMGISKASFKAEKLKNQLEETKHAELLRKCLDFLVAGLIIMCLTLAYGAYVHSYKRITEATAFCKHSEDSKSWWIPKPVASFNSTLNILRCQVQVVTRMVFGFLMILAVIYLLLQRSSTMKQTMPITFILLLLGVACGFAGKLCVDTLGGNGYHWLLYWEALCLLHFFSNIWTSVLFLILYGPVRVLEGTKDNSIFPFWLRRYLFYGIELLFLPLLCGLMPFAGFVEWKDHFLALVTDSLPVMGD